MSNEQTVSSLEVAETRIRAMAKARSAAWLAGILGGFFTIAVVAFVAGVIISENERNAQVAKNTITAHKAAVTAIHASSLAEKNYAIVFAVCRAFHRRDEMATYYDEKLDRVRQKYGYGTNEFLDKAKPIIEERKKVLARLASSDCTALMNKAIADSALPSARRPTPMPLASNLHF